MNPRNVAGPIRAAWLEIWPIRIGPPSSPSDARPVTSFARKSRIMPPRLRVSAHPTRIAPSTPGRGSVGYAAPTPTNPMTCVRLVTGSVSSRRSGVTVRERCAGPCATSTVMGCSGLRRATRAKSCHDTTVSPLTLRMRSPGFKPALPPALPDVTLEMTGSR